MVDRAVADLSDYLSFLTNAYGLQISCHDFMTLTQTYSEELGRYAAHRSPLCATVKSSYRAFEACRLHQYGLLARCGREPFSGMCPCGVWEFVFPLAVGGITVGFFSISGYRNREKAASYRIRNTARRYGLSPAALAQAHAALSPYLPDPGWLCAVFSAAARLYELAYLAEYGTPLLPPAPPSPALYVNLYLRQYIQEHFTERLTVPMLARLCHCSESYISHMFRRQNGVNLNAYINRLRLEHSRRLLRDTRLSIRDVSVQCGFESPAYFSLLFRERFGRTPSAYRKEHAAQ